jgi:hypothetical protein
VRDTARRGRSRHRRAARHCASFVIRTSTPTVTLPDWATKSITSLAIRLPLPPSMMALAHPADGQHGQSRKIMDFLANPKRTASIVVLEKLIAGDVL